MKRTAIKNTTIEKIESFFSYWGHHYKNLGDERLQKFLLCDLNELEKAINEDKEYSQEYSF